MFRYLMSDTQVFFFTRNTLISVTSKDRMGEGTLSIFKTSFHLDVRPFLTLPLSVRNLERGYLFGSVRMIRKEIIDLFICTDP